MKTVIIAGIITLTLLTSCEKSEDPNERMHLIALDAIQEAQPLREVYVYNQEGLVKSMWNSPAYYCALPNGSCDTLSVHSEGDALRIDYSISFIADRLTNQHMFRIPYTLIDSIAVSNSEYVTGMKDFILYVNIGKEAFYDEYDVVEQIRW